MNENNADDTAAAPNTAHNSPAAEDRPVAYFSTEEREDCRQLAAMARTAASLPWESLHGVSAQRNSENYNIYRRANIAAAAVAVGASAASAAEYLLASDTARAVNEAITDNNNSGNSNSNSNNFDSAPLNAGRNLAADIDLSRSKFALPRILGWQPPAALTDWKFEDARLALGFTVPIAQNNFDRDNLIRHFAAIFPSSDFTWGLASYSLQLTNYSLQTGLSEHADVHIELQFKEGTLYHSVLTQIKIAKDAIDYLARLNQGADTQLVLVPTAATIAVDGTARFRPGKRRLLRLDDYGTSAPQSASE